MGEAVGEGGRRQSIQFNQSFKAAGEIPFTLFLVGIRRRSSVDCFPWGLYLKIAHELHKINFSLKKSCQGLEKLLGKFK